MQETFGKKKEENILKYVTEIEFVELFELNFN